MTGLIAGFIAVVLVGLILYAVMRRGQDLDPPEQQPELPENMPPADNTQEPNPLGRPVWRPGDGGNP